MSKACASNTIANVDIKKLRNKKLTSTEFMQVWFHYDKDKSGFLEYAEFSQFMKDLFLRSGGSTGEFSAAQIEKYTQEVMHIMDTYDENRDGKFEMNELAKVLKIEENYLNKIINKKAIKDKHIQSILKHYDSNVNQMLEGCELKAFVGDIIRACQLPYNLASIDQASKLIEEACGNTKLDTNAIALIISLESREKIHRQMSVTATPEESRKQLEQLNLRGK